MFRGSSANVRRAEEIRSAAEKDMLRSARGSNLQRAKYSRHAQLAMRTEMCHDTFWRDKQAVYADQARLRADIAHCIPRHPICTPWPETSEQVHEQQR